MTHPALIERITRSLAYMLRHQPEKFDVEVDAYGWADLEEVIRALNERLGESVLEEDVVEAVESGDRIRYEIDNGRIRALYGHSIEIEPGEPARPPEHLFLAVPARDVARAQRFGLRGGRRRFVHLALNEEDACEAGRRLARDYAVLCIHALEAWEEGVNFYDRKSLFLAEEVPTHLLEVGDTFHDGDPAEEREGERGAPRRGRPERDARPAPRARPWDKPAALDEGDEGMDDMDDEGDSEADGELDERAEPPFGGRAEPLASGTTGVGSSDRGGRRRRGRRGRRGRGAGERGVTVEVGGGDRGERGEGRPGGFVRSPDEAREGGAGRRGPRGEPRLGLAHEGARGEAPSRAGRGEPRAQGYDAPGRPPREASTGPGGRDRARGDSGQDRGGQRGHGPGDRGSRGSRGDRGNRGDRDRGDRGGPPREERRGERTSSEARVERPRDAGGSAPRAPAERQRSGPSFGAGLSEQPARRQEPAPRAAPPPAPERAPEPPPEKKPPPRKDSGGPSFGAGL
jgi:putative RNA 2'-phosphotransferase